MAERVIRTKDLSKKDVQVTGGLIRIKNGSYNIRSNNGANALAPYNESNPTANWTAPSGAKTGAIAHVLFSDGLAYFTYSGTAWDLNWFYASSSFVYTPIPRKIVIQRIRFDSLAGGTAEIENIVNYTDFDWPSVEHWETYIYINSPIFSRGHNIHITSVIYNGATSGYNFSAGEVRYNVEDIEFLYESPETMSKWAYIIIEDFNL